MEASKKKSRIEGDTAGGSSSDAEGNAGFALPAQEGPHKKSRVEGSSKEDQIEAVTQELDELEQSALEQSVDNSLQLVDGDLSLAIQTCVEVFVGGLPPAVEEDAVKEAFSAVGDVLGVKLFKKRRSGECRGYGYVSFPDIATAEKACQQVREVAGTPIGVHVSRGKATQNLPDLTSGPPPVPVQSCDGPDASINQLLSNLRKQPDKVAAVAAALKAAATAGRRRNTVRQTGPATPGTGTTDAAVQQVDDIPDNYLDSFPKCKKLVEQFRSHPNTHNKTPLAVLHEYATRLSLELSYDDKAESALGPFAVEARVTSVGGSILYASGTGKGRNKKDARQYSAAAVLEVLLQNVPESEFMQPGKSKQPKAIQRPTASRPAHMSEVNTMHIGNQSHRSTGAVTPSSGAPMTLGGHSRVNTRAPIRSRPVDNGAAGSRAPPMTTGGRFSGRTRTYSQYSQPSFPQPAGLQHQHNTSFPAQAGGYGQPPGAYASNPSGVSIEGYGHTSHAMQQASSFGPAQSGYSAQAAAGYQQNAGYQGASGYQQPGYMTGSYSQSGGGYHSAAGFGGAMPGMVNQMPHETTGTRPDMYGSGFGATPAQEAFHRQPPVDPFSRGIPADSYAKAAGDGYARSAATDSYPRPSVTDAYHRSPVSDTYGRSGPPAPDMYHPRPMAPVDTHQQAAPHTTPQPPDMYSRMPAVVDAYGRPAVDPYAKSPAADSYGRQPVPDAYGRPYGAMGSGYDSQASDYTTQEPQHKRNMRAPPMGSATPPTAAVGNLSISPGYGMQEGPGMYSSGGGMQPGMAADFSISPGAGYHNGYANDFADADSARGMRGQPQFSKQPVRGPFNAPQAFPGHQQQQQQHAGRLMRP